MKSARVLFAVLSLFPLACVSGSPPAATPASASAPTAGGGASCAGQKIRSKGDLTTCNDACRDQQRDQQRQCSDPSCLQGLGAATNACFAKCDEGKQSAKTAHCYTE